MIDPSIYKVHYLKNNETHSIYVFSGENKVKEEDLYKKCFSEEELLSIQEKKTPIYFLSSAIHKDDTIFTIKTKVLKEIPEKSKELNFSLPEIYLFCQKREKFTTAEVYESLTKNKKIELTRNRLENFLSNIHSSTLLSSFSAEKEIYSYDDLLEMKLDQKSYLVDKILGQKYYFINGEFPFVHNPYNVKENYDYFYEKTTRQSIVSLNQYLLFNTGLEIQNNNIYLCLAKDVLKYADDKGFSPDITSKIYYPVLYSQNIRNLSSLMEKSHDLLNENKNVLTRPVLENNKVVDMFYQIYKERKSELNYLTKGIRSMRMIIHPQYTVKMPLDVIFKLIHATENNPLIKYNPALRQENIYRLYTNQISTDGQKIPSLNKAIIFKLVKNIGKTKSVAVYLERNLKMPSRREKNNEDNEEGKIYSFVCEFLENGDILIFSEFEKAIPEEYLNDLLKESINPLLDEIRDFLQQNGYQVPPFISLYEENIEIKYLNYELQIELHNELKLSSLTCLSSLFIEEKFESKGKKKVGTTRKEIEKTTQLRFKRVANFNKTTSQEAFIIEKINAGYNKEQVILGLLENYSGDLNENEAKDLLARIVGQLNVEKGKKKTDIRIKNNPGFKTIFSVHSNTGILTVSVENINNIDYLSTIPVYLDSIVRITQDKSSTHFSSSTIDRLCSMRLLKGKEEKGKEKEVKEKEKKEKEIHIPNLIIKDSEYSIPKEEEREKEKEKDKDLEIEILEDLKGEKDQGKEEKIQNAMDLFFGNQDEEEEEEENLEGGANDETYNDVDVPSELDLGESASASEAEVEDNISIETSSTNTIQETNQTYKNTIKNIDGMPMNNPYYFQERISQRDPTLIIKEDKGKYNSYARVCPSSAKRQPVILTDEELKKINNEHPGFLRKEDVISYGTNPKKKYNYICPRYWCLKTNSILDPKDFVKKIENGKEILVHPTCGKILPSGAAGKKVIPGHYVYEFFGENEDRYPGFQTDKHPDGFCLPCCFKKPNKSVSKCSKTKGEKDEESEQTKEKEDEYIKGMEKFPLSSGRWGYLPIPLQQFLQISGQTCRSNSDQPCFLRHGVEVNSKQSFLACIANAYFYATSSKVPSIREFKKIMIENLSIDHFINYQNGNLVNDFYNSDLPKEKIEELVNSEKSKKSKLYSLIYSTSYSTDQNAISYYEKVLNSFFHFQEFLKRDDIVINHTYLWDIVTNPKTFLNNRNIPSREVYHFGFNLVILEIPDNDITQNIEIICPTNHYASEPFNPKLGTLILMKKEEYYEPIFSYLDKEQSITVNRFFYADTKFANIRNVLNDVLYPLMNTICKPQPSLPNRYQYLDAITLSSLRNILKSISYSIVKYVFNYNNKIIGVIAKSNMDMDSDEILVPCYPSSFDKSKTMEEDKMVFMTEPSLWKSYEETITFLKELKEKSQNQIPCKPIINVIEDELVVGILTETNQFIQISPPVPKVNIPKEIRLKNSIKGNNVILADSKTIENKEEDKERVEAIRRIRLETNFYNVFRNTIRILLNDYKNVKEREEIENIIKREELLYFTKLQKMIQLLKNLVGDKALFIGDENYSKLMSEVSTCLMKDKDKCKSSNVCAVVENGDKSVCQLILPRKNLINQQDNETIYYGRMADELVRYSRIKNFMLQPETYLSFGNNKVKYNLRENEIILVQSMLTQEYFNRLIPMDVNPYVKNNTYDEVEPLIHPLYENQVNQDSLKTMIPLKAMKQKTIVLEEDKEVTPIKSSTIQIEEPILELKPESKQKIEPLKEQVEEPVLELKPESIKEIEKDDKMNLVNVCKEEIETSIFDKKRNQLFPTNYKEFKYKNNNIACSYDVIIVLLKIFHKERTIYQIKEDLFESYQKYLPSFESKIVDTLKMEGKINLCNQVQQKSLTFENMIMNDAYFLSTMDLWILVQKYQIPVVFMGTYKLLETNLTSKIMVGYQDLESKNSKEYIFIVTQSITKKTPVNKPPVNRLILSNTNQLLINIDLLNKETELYGELIKSIEFPKTIEDFLTKFS